MPAVASSSKSKKSKSHKSSHKTAATTRVEEPSARNEGRDINWGYQPPAEAEPIDSTNEDYGEFDWDAVQEDEDVEVWVIRVPESIKPKHLEGLSFDLDEPTLSTSSPSRRKKRRTALIGSLKRKHNSYDIWSLGDGRGEDQGEMTTEPTSLIGGDELKSLSCLLPRNTKNGKLYAAPKPIARHILVSAQPARPTTTSTDSDSPTEMVYTNPLRENYPPELLTHRFMPYGSLVKTSTDKDNDEDENDTAVTSRMDKEVVMTEVDSNVQSDVAKKEERAMKSSSSNKKKDKKVEEEEEIEVDEERQKEKKEKKKSGRKRKGEEDVSPKKSKKSKTASV
ncbi:hypothetical protein AGABI2DRAFT_176923 [Agaricus bisporus var. bisporus H97]|uniref:hypothetical protein n=1 Tax=Agaricus bisporus var. bisporus (strain H97 / ATCC MYA-4626 / FGSC 10389) TaxID=936046 RepID=UPI00029F7C6A|nr:hypothetical protein AGABI2DRAFT_176923 [Agaricus bisporus var. bisporus H97]EKV50627.1 hypothetical protein AGABI2DRAFT_176923 [Agaricus bisporus var. bisporus H97]